MPAAYWRTTPGGYPLELIDSVTGASIGSIRWAAHLHALHILYRDRTGFWNETTSQYAESAETQLRLWALEDGYRVAKR